MAEIELCVSIMEPSSESRRETRDPNGKAELHYPAHVLVRLDADGRSVVLQCGDEMRLKAPKFQKIVHILNRKH
jgi:hypothetical protein